MCCRDLHRSNRVGLSRLHPSGAAARTIRTFWRPRRSPTPDSPAAGHRRTRLPHPGERVVVCIAQHPTHPLPPQPSDGDSRSRHIRDLRPGRHRTRAVAEVVEPARWIGRHLVAVKTGRVAPRNKSRVGGNGATEGRERIYDPPRWAVIASMKVLPYCFNLVAPTP